MTVHALVNGVLFRAPETKTSKAGQPFAVATVKVKDGERWQWWKLLVFSETAQAELMRLGDGDAVSCQGAMRAELYRPGGGETRLSLSLIADHVLALKQPPRERKPKADNPARPADPARGDRPRVDADLAFETVEASR